jgi:hypothetical protein
MATLPASLPNSLPPLCSQALTWVHPPVHRDHLTRQLEEIEALGDEYQDQGLIFPREKGQPTTVALAGP